MDEHGLVNPTTSNMITAKQASLLYIPKVQPDYYDEIRLVELNKEILTELRALGKSSFASEELLER